MSKQYNFCNNCGKNGHMFHQCKQPITSIGVIAFRYNKGEAEYLMIRRKDSLGFVDFMRGKYPLHNKNYIMNIIDEMTVGEKERLLSMDFDELWSYLWGDNIGIQYRGEEKVSRDKFSSLKHGIKTNNAYFTLDSLITNSKTAWETPEWGYPKGRRNYHEKDLNCALLEFEEETGYLRNKLMIVQNILPVEEIFTGSNYKSYKHRYYIAYLDNLRNSDTEFQKSEVSKVEWKPYSDVCKMIRPYNLEKIDVITRVNTVLSNLRLYM
jgi:8-oxo-dGTP pyrophosphatase MutT (NUDIX family)